MNDYRVETYEKFIALLKAAEKADPNAKGWEIVKGYVKSGLPCDRRGLIAVFHDQLAQIDDEMGLYDLAKRLAIRTTQRVYIVMTEQRWHLLLFAIEIKDEETGEPGLWYDERENDRYANDQYIAHYDPDGTFQLDGLS